MSEKRKKEKRKGKRKRKESVILGDIRMCVGLGSVCLKVNAI